MNIALTLIAVAMGMMITTQAGINSQLRMALGHPVVAAAVSFVIGTAGLLLAALVLRVPMPDMKQTTTVPLWGWTGGLLGAAYITGSIMLAPRLGAAVLIASVMAGQLVAALVLDHFGLLGFVRQTITPVRLTGALLLFAGVYLIQRR
ncbi:MAG: DMT family transporter [Gemmatimonadaceae bacterium]